MAYNSHVLPFIKMKIIIGKWCETRTIKKEKERKKKKTKKDQKQLSPNNFYLMKNQNVCF